MFRYCVIPLSIFSQPLTEEEEREWEDNGFEGLTDSDSLPPPPAGNI